jgi:ABC-type glycerol-3-phosphate transport system permease component
MRLLSVGVVAFLPGAQSPSTWGSLFAMAAVFMAPSLALFLLLQRSFARGLSLGAVAGR